MDAHVLIYYISVFYLSGVLIPVIAEDNSVKLTTTDATRKCVSNYQQCDIKLGGRQGLPGFNGVPGETGDKGDSGPQGVPGPPGLMGPEGTKGDKGDRGETGEAGPQGVPGVEGPQGPKGIKGDKGYPGVSGTPGLPGLTGEKGERGDKGILGRAGSDGDIGPQGPPGDQGDMVVGETGDPGPAGVPGQPGVCDCSLGSVGLNDDEREEGSIEDPFSLPCKGYAELKSGKYYLWMEAVEIYCDMSTNQTCKLGPEPDGDTYSTKDTNSSSVWLSELKPIEIQSLYGLSMEQILWLQERSVSAYQTLRLHYKNFKPEFGPEYDSITLLTCSDIVVKSYPSEETPFFYSVVRETECKNEDEWCYLDLVLVSQWSNKLPIIDVLINVNPGQKSMFKLQNKQLCFG